MYGDYGKNEMGLSMPTNSDTVAGSWPLTPQEAWNIDTKLDDGIASSGFIISTKGNGTNTNCTTYAGVAPPGDTGANYLLSNTSKDCGIFFVRVF
jgi:hypothetical protein